MNSHLVPGASENCVDVLANSLLWAANFALFSDAPGTRFFIQT